MSIQIHVSVHPNTHGAEAPPLRSESVRRLHTLLCRVRPRTPYLQVGHDSTLPIARSLVQENAPMPPGQSPRSSVEAVAPVLSDYECHDFTQTVAAEIGSAVSCIIDLLPPHLAIADGTCCILGHTEACFEIQLRCLPDEGTIRRHPAVSATWPRPPEARDSPSASRVRPIATEPPAFFEAHVQGPCQHGQPSSVCTVCHPSIDSVVYDSVHPAVLTSPVSCS